MSKQKHYSHAFSFCAELLSGEPHFEDVSLSQICSAARKRLDQVEAMNNRGAFEGFDTEDITDTHIPY